MFRALGIKEEVYTLCEEALADLRERFAEIDSIAEYNQLKVVKAFQDAHVSEAHLYGTGTIPAITSALTPCSVQRRISARSATRRMRWG